MVEGARVVDRAWRRGRVATGCRAGPGALPPGSVLGVRAGAAQGVTHCCGGALGGSIQQVVRHDGVVAAGQLARPSGVRGRPEDVAQLGGLGQRVEGGGRAGAPAARAACRAASDAASRPARWASVAAVRCRRDRRPPSANARAASIAVAGRRSWEQAWLNRCRTGSAHATAYAVTARSSSMVSSALAGDVGMVTGFPSLVDTSRTSHADSCPRSVGACCQLARGARTPRIVFGTRVRACSGVSSLR